MSLANKLTLLVGLAYALSGHAQVSDFYPVNFKKADSMAFLCKNETLDNLQELAQKLTKGLNTDVERFRAIYKWTCDNIANDYKLYLKHKRKRKRFKDDSLKLMQWNENLKNIIFKKLRKRQKTICTGYAYVIQQLCKQVNIKCTIINGYGRTSTSSTDDFYSPNHSWNAVRLNGKWYLNDATWSSGLIDPNTGRFNFQYNNGYFLAQPDFFAKTHYPIDTRWLLLEGGIPTFETFLQGPVIYGKAYKHLASHNAPVQMHDTIKKGDRMHFKYQLQTKIPSDQIRLLIDNGKDINTIKPEFLIDNTNTLSFNHQFEDAGFYDVHFKIADDYIATYTVRVEN